MKVCTDSCLFGALLSGITSFFPDLNFPKPSTKILDIGAGTGLLSLMYAQKNERAIIDAVELDDNAAQQAKENFSASLWTKRLNVRHTSIQDFSNVHAEKYNLIFSNPPFYEDNLKSKDRQRNLALHSASLQLEELFVSVKKLLDTNGVFAVLLPYYRTEQAVFLGKENGLYVQKKIPVKRSPEQNYFRSILFFSQNPCTESVSEICIKDDAGNYSKEFTELLKAFYLNL
jgi:tRNA1Val (adenine37-N6)-methyltransferase